MAFKDNLWTVSLKAFDYKLSGTLSNLIFFMYHNYKNVSQIYISSFFFFLGYSLEFPIQIQYVPQKKLIIVSSE